MGRLPFILVVWERKPGETESQKKHNENDKNNNIIFFHRVCIYQSVIFLCNDSREKYEKKSDRQEKQDQPARAQGVGVCHYPVLQCLQIEGTGNNFYEVKKVLLQEHCKRRRIVLALTLLARERG